MNFEGSFRFGAGKLQVLKNTNLEIPRHLWVWWVVRQRQEHPDETATAALLTGTGTIPIDGYDIDKVAPASPTGIVPQDPRCSPAV